jgi:hypothetical protein
MNLNLNLQDREISTFTWSYLLTPDGGDVRKPGPPPASGIAAVQFPLDSEINY